MISPKASGGVNLLRSAFAFERWKGILASALLVLFSGVFSNPVEVLLPRALAQAADTPGLNVGARETPMQTGDELHLIGRRGDYVLSWQLPNGGWGKNLPTSSKRWQPGTPKSTQVAGGVELGSFDNGATIGEMRLLAAAYHATGELRFKEGFERALDFVLAAQYESGGWPQVYPRRGGYSDYVTFNDDAMVNVMRLIFDIVHEEPLFDFVDPKYRQPLSQAFERGIDYILKAQIQREGQLTAWGQQHDPITYEPRSGRPYEHVSITASESVGIVELLMLLKEPTEEVERAIVSALGWFDQVRLPDGRWARFYEIESLRPIFSGRDGIVRYDIMEIEAERRSGYAWYGTWPNALLARARSSGYWEEVLKKHPPAGAPTIMLKHPVPAGADRVQGMLAIDFSIYIDDPNRLELVQVWVGSDQVYSGSQPPRSNEIVYDTSSLENGVYPVVVSVQYDDGKELTQEARFRADNWWTKTIDMKEPEDAGWFGVIDHLGTVERSDDWVFETDQVRGDFDVPHRMMRSGLDVSYLVWETKGLTSAALTVYNTTEEVDAIQFFIDRGDGDWRRVFYEVEMKAMSEVEGVEPSHSRLYQLVLSKAFEGEVEAFRIQIAPEGAGSQAQLGKLELKGRK